VLEVLLRLKPKIVAFTHVSNTLGTINPVREIRREWPTRQAALVLIDGAQATPHVPVDVQVLGADFYASAATRCWDPWAPACCGRGRELLEAMPPFLAGGEMIREVHLRRSDWNDIPWKFEAGTPDVAAAIGLGAGRGLPRRPGHGSGARARARSRGVRAGDPAARDPRDPPLRPAR